MIKRILHFFGFINTKTISVVIGVGVFDDEIVIYKDIENIPNDLIIEDI